MLIHEKIEQSILDFIDNRKGMLLINRSNVEMTRNVFFWSSCEDIEYRYIYDSFWDDYEIFITIIPGKLAEYIQKLTKKDSNKKINWVISELKFKSI